MPLNLCDLIWSSLSLCLFASHYTNSMFFSLLVICFLWVHYYLFHFNYYKYLHSLKLFYKFLLLHWWAFPLVLFLLLLIKSSLTIYYFPVVKSSADEFRKTQHLLLKAYRSSDDYWRKSGFLGSAMRHHGTQWPRVRQVSYHSWAWKLQKYISFLTKHLKTFCFWSVDALSISCV